MIDNDYFWNNVLLLTFGTLALRSSIIAISAKVKISERHKEILSLVPAAILPALTMPMVFFHQGKVSWLFGKERFLILVLATVVCYFSKNLIVTILFGLLCLYLVTSVPVFS